jgi:hypothetical protein
MPFLNGKHTKRHTTKSLCATGKLLDHTANALFQWLTTNHSFYATLYLDPPTPGLLGAIRYAVKSFLISVGVPLLRALLIVVLYMLWIPFLINALLWFLQQ